MVLQTDLGMNSLSSIVPRDRMLMTLILERHESVLILCLCNWMFTRLCLERHDCSHPLSSHLDVYETMPRTFRHTHPTWSGSADRPRRASVLIPSYSSQLDIYATLPRTFRHTNPPTGCATALPSWILPCCSFSSITPPPLFFNSAWRCVRVVRPFAVAHYVFFLHHVSHACFFS
jgi:hypothetical protein